jgi:hypothetical protein
VTIGVNSSDVTEGGLGNVSSVTFTTASWSTVQDVTVTGADDYVADGNITFAVAVSGAASDDSNYNGVDGADVNVMTVDGMSFCCEHVWSI